VTERTLLTEAARLFNDKLYFEAHDYLEDAWQDARGEERAFLQALIHVCVGMYHVAAANHQGAVNLLSRALDALARFAPSRDGLDVAALTDKGAICLDKSRRLLEGESVEWVAGDVPRMELGAAE